MVRFPLGWTPEKETGVFWNMGLSSLSIGERPQGLFEKSPYGLPKNFSKYFYNTEVLFDNCYVGHMVKGKKKPPTDLLCRGRILAKIRGTTHD